MGHQRGSGPRFLIIVVSLTPNLVKLISLGKLVVARLYAIRVPNVNKIGKLKMK